MYLGCVDSVSCIGIKRDGERGGLFFLCFFELVVARRGGEASMD